LLTANSFVFRCKLFWTIYILNEHVYFAVVSILILNFFESFSLYYYLSQSEYFPFFCFAKLMRWCERWCAEIPDLFRVLNMISHEWAQRTSEISCSTREINPVFPSTHVFFCLLYKQNSMKNNNTSVAMRFTTNDIFTRKNIVFFTCV
jgi:hypothetical protein